MQVSVAAMITFLLRTAEMLKRTGRHILRSERKQGKSFVFVDMYFSFVSRGARARYTKNNDTIRVVGKKKNLEANAAF